MIYEVDIFLKDPLVQKLIYLCLSLKRHENQGQAYLNLWLAREAENAQS